MYPCHVPRMYMHLMHFKYALFSYTLYSHILPVLSSFYKPSAQVEIVWGMITAILGLQRITGYVRGGSKTAKKMEGIQSVDCRKDTLGKTPNFPGMKIKKIRNISNI